MVGREVHQLAIEPEDGAQHPVAESHGAPHDRIEDRLHVGRRLADHAQDLAGRSLLLQRLGEVRLRASSSVNRRTFSIAITA